MKGDSSFIFLLLNNAINANTWWDNLLFMFDSGGITPYVAS